MSTLNVLDEKYLSLVLVAMIHKASYLGLQGGVGYICVRNPLETKYVTHLEEVSGLLVDNSVCFTRAMAELSTIMKQIRDRKMLGILKSCHICVGTSLAMMHNDRLVVVGFVSGIEKKDQEIVSLGIDMILAPDQEEG